MADSIKPGTEQDGYRFVGGDPSKQQSWEPVDGIRVGDVQEGFQYLGGDPSNQRNWKKADRSYLGAAAESGGRSLLAAGARIVDELNPFTLSERDAAALYKNDPEGFKKVTENSAAMALSRFANEQTRLAKQAMTQVAGDEKGSVSGKPLGELEYATTDPDKAAYLSPTRVAGDVLQSLPSTIALAAAAYLTKGASTRASAQAEAAALARGASAAEAKAAAQAAAIETGASTMATTGAIGEGAVGYGQQVNDTRQEAMDIKPEVYEQSPEYQALIAQGYDPEVARRKLVAEAAQNAGLIAGAVDAGTNLVGGRILGKVIGEGGKLGARTAKGIATESATEIVQSGGEQLGSNFAQQTLNPNIDLTKGVGEAMVAGGVVGGVTGGATAAAFGSPHREATQKLDSAKSAGEAVAAADELAGSVTELTQSLDQMLGAAVPGAAPAPVNMPAAVQTDSGQNVASTPGVDIPGLRDMADRDAALMQQANTAGTEAERVNAVAQAQVNALPQPDGVRGEASPRPNENIVDLTPMDPRQAQARLAILRDQTAQEGGNALELIITPHPSQPGKLAIGRQTLPDLSLGTTTPEISPQEAQNRLETAALTGKVDQLRQEDRDSRQVVIDRALRNVEERGGVASPAEAKIFQEAGLGKPYDRIDTTLAPALSTDQKLTQATGIALDQAPRSEETQRSGPTEQQLIQDESNARSDSRLQQLAADRAAAAQAAAQDTRTAAQAPNVNNLISALATPGIERTAEQNLIIRQGRDRLSAADFSIAERAATAPFRLNTEERVRLRDLRTANTSQAPASTSAAESVAQIQQVRENPYENNLLGERVRAALGQPSNGAVVTTGAKFSSQRAPAPGMTETVNDNGETHSFTVADGGAMGAQGRLLQQVARIFGKRLVIFNSDTLKADGFVRDGDNRNIYINAKSGVSPLAVFGHELLHIMKRENAQAYEALVAVVQRNMDETGKAKFDEYYGEGANLEEMTADLMGNQFQDPAFWTDVFNEIAAQNPEGARAIVLKVAAAMNRAINAFMNVVKQGQFKSDEFVSDLNAIKAAVKDATVSYAQSQRGAAEAMAREDQAAPAQPGKQPFAYSPGLQGNKRQMGVPLIGSDERVMASPQRPQTARMSRQRLVETASLDDTLKIAQQHAWPRGRDLKVAMQQKVLDAAMAAGLDVSRDTPETRDYLRDVGMRDALMALKQNPNAIGWYDLKTRQALAVMSLVHPEIARDENARFAFTWALAVTSNGLKVGKNFELAEKVYETYKRTGTMPTNIGIGTARGAIDESLALFNELRTAWGMDNLRQFMQTNFTVSEITGIAKDLKPGGEHADVTVKGAAILGPKIGNGFFSNLYGNFDSLTMDRWLVRTWGRWTGTLIKPMPEQTAKARTRLEANLRQILANPTEAKRLGDLIEMPLTADTDADILSAAVQKASMDPVVREKLNESGVGTELRKAGNGLAKYLDGQKEAPANPDERKYIRAIFGDILSELKRAPAYKDLTMADLQAVLWYAEKRLYETAKENPEELAADEDVEGYADEEAPDYANAAADVARNKGITDRRVNAALRKVENERSGTARPAAEQSAGTEQGSGAGQQAAPGGFARQEKRQFIGERAVLRARANRASNAQQPGSYQGDGGKDGGRVRVLKSLGVSYTQSWKVAKDLAPIYRANDIATPEFLELAQTPENAQRFQAALSESKANLKFGAAVYVYPAEDYQGMRLFLTKDGKSGVAVKPDGDIVSVFSTSGAGRAVMELAVAAGGRKLDAFDTILPEFYAPHGFKAVARTRWNDAFAPENWNKDTFREFNNGEPDVVFMAYDPAKRDAEYSPKDGRVMDGEDGYDRAVKMQTREMNRARRANPGQFSRTRAEQAENEYTRVYEKYVGTPEWLKAPNGQDTKLTERQWIQVRTPSFKSWFGDWEKFAGMQGGVWNDDKGEVSKVVGDDGEPLVVYHGTYGGGFSEFFQPRGERRGDLGIFATPNLEMAKSYRKGNGGEIQFASMDPDELGKTTDEPVSGYYASFMNIRNPNESDFAGALWSGERPGQYVVLDEDGVAMETPDGKMYFDELRDAERAMEAYGGAEVDSAPMHHETTDSVVKDAYKFDNDGAIIRNVIDAGGGVQNNYMDEPSDVFVALDPNQIKSATQNTGEFGKSKDMRFSRTREFQEWFGDSKVVDGQGEPLVMYHGTRPGNDITEFRAGNDRDGIYFTPDSSYAEGFTEELFGDSGAQGAIYPVYLSVQNPYEVRTTWGSNEAEKFLYRGLDRQQLERQGYDGAMLYIDGELDQAMVFKPSQIKSVYNDTPTDSGDITQSKQRIVGESKRNYTPEQLAMFKNTGRTVDVPTIKERVAELRKDLGKKMAQGLADQFRPLKDLSKEAYALARLSKGAAGAFEAFLHHGRLSIRDNVYDADTSGGFIERLGVPLHGELEDFMWWVAANRAARLKAEGRENLFSDADIAAGKSLDSGTTDYDYTIQYGPEKGKITRDRTKIYRDAQQVFNEFHKNALDMAEQSGLIDAESRKVWENEFYVPFYRVSEEEGGFIGAKIGQSLVRQRAFQKLKGGTDKLNSDLLANTLQNWGHLIDAAAKNRAAKASLEAAQNVGIAIESTEEASRSMAKSMGLKNNVVWFMDEGKARYFVVEDPMVMQAITSLEFAGLRGPLMDSLSKFKHWLTIGVTASPAFKIRNLVRDSMQAVATAELSYNVAGNMKQGFAATKRDSQDYATMLASGALIRFGTMEGSKADQTRRLIKKGVKDSTILDSVDKVNAMYAKYIEPAVAAYNELGNRGEEINRAALYKQLTAKGMSHQEASLMARDLMDFSMQGTFTTVRFLTQVVPFMNARIQGLYKLGRASQEDTRRFSVVLGAVALASIALMAAYHDDDDWKKREDWDRNSNWWFKVGGVAFRIPKPFEIGAIATMAERGLEYFTSKEMTGKRLGKNYWDIVLDNLSMNPVPQAVKPIIDLYANKDSFSGRPIETMGMEKLKPQYRFTQNTSMVARGLSTATGGTLSPVQFDHVMRGYFGWLGSFVVGGADMVIRPLTNEATRPQADYWKLATAGIAAEVESGSSRYVSQMYDQAKVLEQAYGTYRALLKEGKVAEAKDFAESNKDELARYRSVEKVKAAEAKFNERIRMIERSAMSQADKKEKIREIQAQKDRVARLVAPGLR